MTSETKKLISNLKKEIEEIKNIKKNFAPRNCYEKFWEFEIKMEHQMVLAEKQAQLQFAEKLMKLRDKEEKERLNKLIEKIKEDVEELGDWYVNDCCLDFKERIIKILNEALEKCQK